MKVKLCDFCYFLGGLAAVIYTDALQAGILVIGTIVIAGLCMYTIIMSGTRLS